MAGLLYLLKDVPTPNAPTGSEERDKVLCEYGLERLSGLKYTMAGAVTEDEKRVWVVNPQGESLGSKQAHCKYLPEQQTWLEFSSYYIGYWNNDKPRPVDLQRGEVWGMEQEMGDGQEWTIPIVPISFPMAYVLAPDGSTYKRISEKAYPLLPLVEKFMALDEKMEPFRKRQLELYPAFQAAKETGDVPVLTKIIEELDGIKVQLNALSPPVNDRMADVAKLLSSNYIMGAEELSLLGLLDDYVYREVVSRFIMDQDSIDEFIAAKKNKRLPLELLNGKCG
jgi:hypothetical protein